MGTVSPDLCGFELHESVDTRMHKYNSIYFISTVITTRYTGFILYYNTLQYGMLWYIFILHTLLALTIHSNIYAKKKNIPHLSTVGLKQFSTYIEIFETN
jgi:uncharacterized membrane protein YcgQ (UPF0703/DUF1980 family)